MGITEAFKDIEDKRVKGRTWHALGDILAMCVVGFLCGETCIEDIVFFCEADIDRLRKVIPFKNGVPKKDTVYRVLASVDHKELEKAMAKITGALFPNVEGVVAVDGKTVRGSACGGRSGVHIVSAWANELGVCLAQRKTEEKSNEITAIPELLDLLDIRGSTVTIDAMGCQREICRKIKGKGGEYLISLKGNQSTLHDDVKDIFAVADDEKFCEEYKIKKGESVLEKDHGRIERRQCFLCTQLSWLGQRAEWAGLGAVGMSVSKRIVNGVESTERRYFITSLTDVDKVAKALRSHWGVENSLHWTLDMVFDEDRIQCRRDNSPQNLALLRKLALNAMKTAPLVSHKKKMTVKNRQTLCRLRLNDLELVLKYI